MILGQLNLRYKQFLKALEKKSVWFEYYAEVPEFLEQVLLMGLGIPKRVRDKIVLNIRNELETHNDKYFKMMRKSIKDGKEKELFLKIVKMFYEISEKEIKKRLKNRGNRKNKKQKSLR